MYMTPCNDEVMRRVSCGEYIHEDDNHYSDDRNCREGDRCGGPSDGNGMEVEFREGTVDIYIRVEK